MKILEIKKLETTDQEDYTKIKFRTWWGKEFTKMCVTPNWNVGTKYAESYQQIPVQLWEVVKAFLRTGKNEITYY